MRALVVTNMYPSPDRPMLGRFVADQVEALRGLPGLEIEVFGFDGGGMGAYVRAGRELRARYADERFDVVHAHFGLTAWPALAVPARVHGVTLHGTDLSHPRSRAITLAALRRLQLVGAVSAELAARVPALAVREPVQVLPCGVDMTRFRPLSRSAARLELGLEPGGRYLLFGADPARPEKRHDLAVAVSEGFTLLTLGAVAPERVPLYVNAADAVLVPSDREGFGLAVLEALACDVPVLATPHGVAPEALAGVEAAYCGPFSLPVWRSELARVSAGEDPRAAGRAVAERWSAVAMAERVAATWRRLVGT
jgi:glycosyltransferase involved in cell wall biosynthesis